MKRSQLKALIREEIKIATRFRENRSNNRFDYDDPTSPLAQFNDGEGARILTSLMDKYGKDIIQYWVTSGEWTDSEYR